MVENMALLSLNSHSVPGRAEEYFIRRLSAFSVEFLEPCIWTDGITMDPSDEN